MGSGYRLLWGIVILAVVAMWLVARSKLTPVRSPTDGTPAPAMGRGPTLSAWPAGWLG
jgi:hypothetical protein